MNAITLHRIFGLIQIILFIYGIYAIFAFSFWFGIATILGALFFGFIGTLITSKLLLK